MFVDDEGYVLQTLKNIFRREFTNYHKEFAQGSTEALGILNQLKNAHDEEMVVFSDWLMPDMKGDELLKQIHSQYPHSTNFLLSGMIGTEITPEVMKEGGINRVLQKPWDNQQLKHILKEVLQNP